MKTEKTKSGIQPIQRGGGTQKRQTRPDQQENTMPATTEQNASGGEAHMMPSEDPVHLSMDAMRHILETRLVELGGMPVTQHGRRQPKPAGNPQAQRALEAYGRQIAESDRIEKSQSLEMEQPIIGETPAQRHVEKALWLLEVLEKNGVEAIKMMPNTPPEMAIAREVKLRGLIRRMDGSEAEFPETAAHLPPPKKI